MREPESHTFRLLREFREEFTRFRGEFNEFRTRTDERFDELERPLVAEFYQRCFNQELPESSVNVALS